MIEAIFVISLLVYFACQRQQAEGLTYYQPQQHYCIRETIIELPDGRKAVHRELEWHG